MIEKFVPPTEPVVVDLGDGKERELRYTLATLRRLRKRFGLAVLNGELLRTLDEETLPELLFEGLVDKTGLSPDAIAEMVVPAATPYLVHQFIGAFTGSFPSPDPNGPKSQPTT
jgi:hypothetical protein